MVYNNNYGRASDYLSVCRAGKTKKLSCVKDNVRSRKKEKKT